MWVPRSSSSSLLLAETQRNSKEQSNSRLLLGTQMNRASGKVLHGLERIGMEEKYFSVELAARILGCHVRTVQRLIVEGWLSRPEEEAESPQVGGQTARLTGLQAQCGQVAAPKSQCSRRVQNFGEQFADLRTSEPHATAAPRTGRSREQDRR